MSIQRTSCTVGFEEGEAKELMEDNTFMRLVDNLEREE